MANEDDFLTMPDEDFLREGESLKNPTTEEEITTAPVEENNTEVETASEENAEAPLEENNSEETSSENTGLSPEEQLAKLFAPFKANGKDFQVKDIDEAISLAQMGVNYSKKMAGLKPAMRILKMLENNGLLDEQKLTYLIDLDKKNPGAINKLVKESGVDPLDIDLEKSHEYTPGQYQVSDLEMQVSDVLDNIQVTNPTQYPQILQVITSLDNASKREISEDPTVLKHLSDQMANGNYDRITTEMERRMVLGQLSDSMPFLHAYFQVGMDMKNSGTLFTGLPVQAQKPLPTDNHEKANDRKRAVAAPRSTASTTKKAFDPLSMSDAEILRIANQRH